MNLRHRVRIEAKTRERSSTGAITEVWTTALDRVPAEIRPMSGRELVAAQQVNAEVSTWIGIRYVAGVEPTMRVVHPGDGDRVYQILTVLPDPTQRGWIRLMCSSGLTRG